MARTPARRNPRRNPPPTGEEEPAGPAPTEDSDTYTPALAESCVPTPAPTPAAAVALAPAAIDSVAKYLAENLQGILKTILKARAPASQQDSYSEKPLKARAPDIYRGKTHMECYNFCRECEVHFATAGATGLNRAPFAATFLKDQALFRWQQYQHKLADKTDVPITWEKFKAFLRQSLGELKAFVDSIWSTIRKES